LLIFWFCVVFYGPEFKTAFKPLIDALDNDPYLWEDLENRFILWRVSLKLQEAGIMIHTAKQWKLVGDLATVRDCAEMVEGKMAEMMNEFSTKTGGVTEAPHRRFWVNSNTAGSMKFRVPTTRAARVSNKVRSDAERPGDLEDLDQDGELTPPGKKKRRRGGGGGKEEEEKDVRKKAELVCYLSLTELLQVKTKEGAAVKCTNKECKFIHKTALSDITQAQARAAGKAWIKDADIRASLKEKFAQVPNQAWKEAPAPSEGKGGGRENKRRKVSFK
jgi:hypothetical protein